MSDAAVTTALPAADAHGRLVARVIVVAAYALLGVTLLWSRLADLGKSFWFDESFFVAHFVRKGPGEILTGPALSHELHGILAWAAGHVAGESETAYRLLSAVPFVAGVALVTLWLHRRVSAGSALLYLFLATVSPLLLDITRQARGYGLAYLAMSVVVVAALEADRTHRDPRSPCVRRPGSAHGRCPGRGRVPRDRAVLALDRRLRTPALVGLVASSRRSPPGTRRTSGRCRPRRLIPTDAESTRLAAHGAVRPDPSPASCGSRASS